MKRVAAVIVCAVLLAACSKGGDEAAPGEAAPTTEAAGPVAPLTGLPQNDDTLRNRPLLTVKIDNHPQARPQYGVDKADVIVEEKVEGGLSRFMALFQSSDADTVGPVRSLRSTDANWLEPLGGMIAYSGGIDPVKALLKPNGIVDIGADSNGPKYYKRRSGRPFEHSLTVNTKTLRELTPSGVSAPPALFEYTKSKESFGGSTAAPLTSASFRMASLPTSVRFDWTWDAGAGVFRRGTDGSTHSFEGAGQIGMKNVIIQFTPYRQTPWRDTAGTPVDEANVVGSGDAWILSDGKIVRGKWNRASDKTITKYTDATGAPVKLHPGKTWLSLVPPGELAEAR